MNLLDKEPLSPGLLVRMVSSTSLSATWPLPTSWRFLRGPERLLKGAAFSFAHLWNAAIWRRWQRGDPAIARSFFFSNWGGREGDFCRVRTFPFPRGVRRFGGGGGRLGGGARRLRGGRARGT